MMQRTVIKVGQILRRVQHTRCLTLSACNFSERPNTTCDQTTHFGFETVTEAEKEKKGLSLSNSVLTYVCWPFFQCFISPSCKTSSVIMFCLMMCHYLPTLVNVYILCMVNDVTVCDDCSVQRFSQCRWEVRPNEWCHEWRNTSAVEGLFCQADVTDAWNTIAGCCWWNRLHSFLFQTWQSTEMLWFNDST